MLKVGVPPELFRRDLRSLGAQLPYEPFATTERSSGKEENEGRLRMQEKKKIDRNVEEPKQRERERDGDLWWVYCKSSCCHSASCG